MPKNKKGSAMPVESAVPYIPPTRIRLSKEQPGEVSIGAHVSLKGSGEIVGIQATNDYVDGKDKITGYEIELSNSKVSDIEGNKADRALKEMEGK